MRGGDERSGAVFSTVDLERRVPAEHPLRVIRTASENAPLASMGRIGAVAFDPKRNEILAPN